VSVGEHNYAVNVVSRKHLTSRVAWVDHHNCSRLDALFLRVEDLLLDAVDIHSPVLLLVKEVWQQVTFLKGQLR
jgi:hypothetical protein